MLSGGPAAVVILPVTSFTQKIQNLDLTIYEKEDGIGGTWYVNRYPVSIC